MNAACFSPDGKSLAIAGLSFIELSGMDGAVKRVLDGHAHSIRSVEFSTDGKFFILNGKATFDLASGKFYPRIPAIAERSKPEKQIISADGKYFLKTVTHSGSYDFNDLDNDIYENFALFYNSATEQSVGIFLVDSTDWIAINGKGQFDGSENALRACYFVNKLTSLTDYPKIARHPLHIPGLLLSVISGSPPNQPDTSRASKAKPDVTVKNRNSIECCEVKIVPIEDDNPAPELQATVIKPKLLIQMPLIEVFFNGHKVVKDAREFVNKGSEGYLDDTLYIKLPVKLQGKGSLVQWNEENVFDIRVMQDDGKTIMVKTEVHFKPAHAAINPQLMVPAGHSGAITSLAVTKDRKFVYSGGMDGQVKMWDTESHQPIKSFNAHEGSVMLVQLDATEQFLLARVSDRFNYLSFALGEHFYPRIWSIADEKIVEFPITSSNYTRFSGDGKFVMNAQTGEFYDIKKKVPRKLDAPVNKSWFFSEVSTNGETAFIMSTDFSRHGVLMEYDLVSGKKLQQVQFDSPYLNDIWLSSNGKRIATLTPDDDHGSNVQFSIFSTQPLVLLNTIPAPDKDSILYYGFSADDTRLQVVMRNGETRHYDLASKKIQDVSPKGEVLTAALLNDANGLSLKGFTDGSIGFRKSAGEQQILLKGIKYITSGFKISPDNRSVLITRNGDHAAKVFRFIPGEELVALNNDAPVDETAYSPDGKYMITLHNHGEARLWDAAGGLMNTFFTPGEQLERAEFTKDSKRVFLFSKTENGTKLKAITVDIATGDIDPYPPNDEWYGLFKGHAMNEQFMLSVSDDGIAFTKRSDYLNTNAVTAQLILLDSTDWILYTPDGFYMASRQGAEKAYFKLDNKIYPFEQFDVQYNRPDIVLQRLGVFPDATIENYRNAYRKRLDKMGFNPDNFKKQRSFNVPDLQVRDIRAIENVKERLYKFNIHASDPLYKLDRVQAYINNVPVFGEKGIDLGSKKTTAVDMPIQLNLSAGINRIRLSVYNEKGAESVAEHWAVNYNAPVAMPDLYLVSIGAGIYKDSALNLRFAQKDAGDVLRAFSTDSTRYSHLVPLPLMGDQVTTEALKAIKKKLLLSKPDDQVIVFYAGHGLRDATGDYYLGSYNVNTADPALTGIPFSSIMAMMEDIPARKRILFVDACLSGEVDKTALTIISLKPGMRRSKSKLPANAFELMRNTFVDLRNNAGICILSASSGIQVAVEGSEWKNGVFTYYLLDGLKDNKADTNGDGHISLLELQNYLRGHVSDITRGNQVPEFRTAVGSEGLLIR